MYTRQRTAIYLLLFGSLLPTIYASGPYRGISYLAGGGSVAISAALFISLSRNSIAVISTATRNNKLLVFFFFVFVLGSFASSFVSPHMSLPDVFWPVSYFGVGISTSIVISSIITYKNAHYIYFESLCLTGVLLSIVGIVIFITGETSFIGMNIRQVRFSSLYKGYVNSSIIRNANDFGSTLLVCFGSAIMVAKVGGKYYKYLGYTSALLIAVGVVTSGSRGALGGLVLIVAVYLTAISVGFWSYIWTITGVGTLYLLTDIFATESVLSARSLGVSKRAIIWPEAVRIALDNPLGLGYSFSSYLHEIFAHNIGLFISTHNTFLDMLVKGGILLIVSYATVLAVTFYRLYSEKEMVLTANLLMSMLVGLLFVQLFSVYTPGGLTFPSLNLCLILGLSNMLSLY